MRAVRQACGATFEEVEEFLMNESFPVVRNRPNTPTEYHVYMSVSRFEVDAFFLPTRLG